MDYFKGRDDVYPYLSIDKYDSSKKYYIPACINEWKQGICNKTMKKPCNSCQYRENKPIETTLELVEVIKSAVPMKFRIDKHPARQIFQAIRIEVNHELDVIEPALEQALSLIKVGGRVAVITFHSLEDRIVKNTFKEHCAIDERVKGLPNIPDEYLPDFKLVVSKAIVPSQEELEHNPRARSSKLRVIERVK